MLHQRKAFQLLQTLSPAERRRFKKWLASPVHNANVLLSKFYQYIDTRSEWTDRTLNPEKIMTFVSAETPYDDLSFRRLLSEFLAQLEDFLVFEHWQNRPEEVALQRARVYRLRQMPREATGRLSEASADLQQRPWRDASYYLAAYRLQEEKLQQAPARAVALNMQEMSDELGAFFAAELLRNACTALSHQAVYRADYRLPYLDAVLADCAEGRFDRAPVIRLYYLSYRCLTRPDAEKEFMDLKSLLPDAGRWLPPDELRNVFTFAINYCIRRLNTGAEHYLKEVLDLYKAGLLQGVFLENGVLNRFTFKNIVAASLKEEELEWVGNFIRQYAPLLPLAHREAYERFALAKLAYQNGDREQVRTLLHELRSDDVFLDLDARVLLLKIYFELGEWRLLRGFLVAFERFVSRKKMLPYQAPNYRNIIHLTGRLMQWHTEKATYLSEEIEVLRQQILDAQPLTERAWLLAQLDRAIRIFSTGAVV